MTLLLTPPRALREMKREPVFQPMDFFMLRTPLLPVQMYHELFSMCQEREPSIERLATMAERPEIREAIAVASLSLLHALPHLEQGSHPRKQDQAVRGFLRYLLRMTTRPTPFGLFSGVTYGRLDERAQLRVDGLAAHRKRSRPDLKWLLRLIRDLEANLETVQQLRVRTNPLVHFIGSRAILPYVTHYGQSTSDKVVHSVGASEVVRLALAEAEHLLPFADLLERIHARYSDTPREKISQFLWQLFQQEFLISELRPPMTGHSPLGYLRDRLEDVQGIEKTKAGLQKIAEQLAAYDDLTIGEGEFSYRELVKDMRDLADEPHVLQVDLALAKRDAVLPRGVAEEAARGAEVLWRLSPADTGKTHLASYRQEFVNRYGRGREVPLLELLDEDYGLGAPASYRYPASRRESAEKNGFKMIRQERLLHLINQAIRFRQIEVELTEERIRLLEPCEPDERYAPASMEIYLTLAARSEQAVEAGEYRLILGGNPGSQGAGKTFGRFVDLLGEEIEERLQDVQEREQGLRPGALFAEVSLLPNDGRAGNVMLTKSERPYEIAIGGNAAAEGERTIPVSDLVVGVRGDVFYLRSRSLNRDVIPTVTHMFNPMETPNVYRFLRELAVEGCRSWLDFQWLELEASPFLPRLRHGRVVISPATWNLGRRTEPFDQLSFAEALQSWRKEWDVPRHVYMKERDNRLLLDLEHPLHVDEVEREFRKLKDDQMVTLCETGFELEEQLVTGQEGLFINEIVFPLVKGDRFESLQGERTSKPLPLADVRGRTHLPGGEWLFCKLYGPQGREEELIGQHLGDFCQEMERAGLCDASFFMRYADPEPHVRLRFHGEPNRLTGELLQQVHRFARVLQEQGLLRRLAIDTYEPELERYGGPALIARAERMFAEDSQVVAAWWQAKRHRQIAMDAKLFAVISVIDLLEKFRLPLAEQVRWFDEHIDTKQDREEFRSQRRLLLTVADPSGDWKGLRAQTDGAAVLAILARRGAATDAYAGALQEAARQEELWTSLEDVLGSVIHLHLNRLLGTDRKEEAKVMAMVRHTLAALQQMRVNRV